MIGRIRADGADGSPYPRARRAPVACGAMAKTFDAIDDRLRSWIERQRMFFVGTAPSGRDGHVNVSPKGPIETLRVVDEHTVAYLDLVGSGAETIAHLRDNGRIVVMLCAFEGPPRIVRLHGRGELLAAPARSSSPPPARAPSATAPSSASTSPHRRLVRLRRADHELRGRAPAGGRVGGAQARQGRAGARGLQGREERDEHRRPAGARLSAVRFEKWQALGNDYVIVEAAALAGRELTPGLARALCDRHRGIGADGVLVLRRPTRRASSPACGSSTPTAPRPS